MRNFIRSAALLLAGAALGAGLSSLKAQVSKVTQIPPAGGSVSASGEARQIVPSSQLSLRVEGQRGGRVIGTLMTKVGDEWVEVQFAPQDSFAKP